jgi:hypothetical protein
MDIIWIHAPGTNKKYLDFDASPLGEETTGQQKKITNIGVPVSGRPNLEELKRLFKEITLVKIFPQE